MANSKSDNGDATPPVALRLDDDVRQEEKTVGKIKWRKKRVALG